jgi:hypothetical protein
MLFGAHDCARIHNLSLTDEWKGSDARKLTSRGKLDDTAIVWPRRLRTNENP